MAKLLSRKGSKGNSVSIKGNIVTIHQFNIDNPVIVQFLNSYESPENGLKRFFDLWTQMLEHVEEPDHMSLLNAKESLELMQKHIENSLTVEVMVPPCSLQNTDQIRVSEIPDQR
jgi:hypothetical protein